MKKNLTRFFALIYTISTVFASLVPLQSVAKTIENGTITWDFEDASDIAALSATFNGNQAAEEAVFESGVWSREAGSWNENGEPKNGPLEPVWQDYADLTKENADGGLGCVAIKTIQTWDSIKSYSTGMAITLDESEIIPGMEYTIELDAAHTHNWSHWIYAGFGKPSERTTSTMDSSCLQWNKKHKKVVMENAALNDGSLLTDGGVATGWAHGSTTITAEADMFENGKIILYVANYDSGGGTNGTNGIFYLDNITLIPAVAPTPVPTATPKPGTEELFWDFEDSSQVAAYANGQTQAEEQAIFESGVWAREVGTWNLVSGDEPWFMRPAYVEHSSVAYTANCTDQSLEDGGTGVAQIEGGNANVWNTYTSMAMAIMLDEAKLAPGVEYTLQVDSYRTNNWIRNMYIGYSAPSKRSTSARLAEKANVDWLNNGGLTQIIFDNEDANGNNGVDDTKWSHGTTKITVPASAYENGKVILYIGGVNMDGGVDASRAKLYMDNIRLTPAKTPEITPTPTPAPTPTPEPERGLFWDFEDSSQVAAYANGQTQEEEQAIFDSGVWAREVATWNLVSGDEPWFMRPVYVGHSDVAYNASCTDQSLEDGGTGVAQMEGGNGAAWGRYTSMAMAILLDNTKLIPGQEYMVELDSYRTNAWIRSLYVGYSAPSKRSTSARLTEKANVDWLNNGGLTQIIFDNEDTNGNNGVDNKKWSHGTAKITIPASAYENGKVILYIGAVAPDGGVDADRVKLYMDNIRLTPCGAAEEDPELTEVISGLSWDFESKTDIANPANVDAAHEKKIIESGVWAREAGSYDGNPADQMEPYSMALSGMTAKPSNGGSQCLRIDATASGWSTYRSLAMSITLSDKQLVPDRSYTLSLDAYYSASWEKAIYTGFSKPSERTTSTKLSNEIAAWIDGQGYQQIAFNNKGTDGLDGISNAGWSHGSITITPTADMYENGYVVLYIGNVEHAGVDAGVSLYFDNIKIDPIAPVKNPLISELNYGKIWTFEEGANDTSAVLGSFTDNVWAPLSEGDVPGEDTAAVPAYKSESEVAMGSHGYFGKMAPGSTTAIAINNESKPDVILGTRVRISKDEISGGTYKLALRAGATTSSYNLYAAVIPGSTAIDTTDEVSTRASLSAAVQTVDLGVLCTNWSKYQANINIFDSSFGADGYITLVLYAGIGSMAANETLYLDDISLSSFEEPDVNEIKSLSGYLTTVFDYGRVNTIIAAAAYDGNKMLAIDTYQGPQKAINHTAFSVALPEALDEPKVRLFVWNGRTLAPIEEARDIAAEYIQGTLNLDWSSKWIDAENNRYEETQTPTAQPDGRCTAQISVNNGLLTKVTVYGADNNVFAEGMGNSLFTIDVPATEEYTVQVTAKDTKNHIVSDIGTYTKAQFDALTSYPSAPFNASGKLVYRMGFEKQTVSYLNVVNGSYQFVKGGAAGGDYSMKVTSGTGAASVRLDAMRYAGKKVSVTAYVKVPGATSATAMRGAAIITPTSGSETLKPVMLSISGGDWNKITTEFDLTSYSASSLASLEIEIISSPQKKEFCVDDIIVSATGNGTLMDDDETQYYALDAISSKPIVQSANSADLAVNYEELPSLKDLYKDYFKMGACVVNAVYEGHSPEYTKLVLKHFNSLVADGSMRPEWYVDAGGSVTTSTGINDPKSLSAANSFMNFAKKNGIKDVVGHTLFTYGTPKWRDNNQTRPGFFSDENGNALSRDVILQRAQEHVKLIVNHFNGKGKAEHYKLSGETYLDPADYQDWRINTWDICNEIVNRGNGAATSHSSYRAGSDSNVNFYNAVGADFAQYMYKAARDTDSTLELRLNEAEDNDWVRNNFLNVINHINASNNIAGGAKLIDKIGLQTHIRPDMDPGYIRQSIEKYVATGLKLDITEYDYNAYSFINEPTSQNKFANGITKMREFDQAMMLRDCFEIFKEFSGSIDRVGTWTVSDEYGQDAKRGGYMDFPAMFDRNMNPKPMFWAIAESEEDFMKRYPEFAGQFTKKRWTFDSISDMSYGFSTGGWTKLDPDRYVTQPIIVDDGVGGGYLKVQRGSDYGQNEGVRIKLSDKQAVPGKTMTLKFKARFSGTATGEAGSKSIYAAFAPPSEYLTEYETSAGTAEFISKGKNCGTVGSNWTSFEVQMTPYLNQYEDGYISLYLSLIGARPNNWNANGEVTLCLDDIIIE